MAKEEIVASLQNAVIRGESLDRAVQTMVSAGYPQADVQDASRYVNMGIIGKISAENKPAQEPALKKKSSLMLIISLIIIFLAIVGIGAYLYFRTGLFGAILGLV